MRKGDGDGGGGGVGVARGLVQYPPSRGPVFVSTCMACEHYTAANAAHLGLQKGLGLRLHLALQPPRPDPVGLGRGLDRAAGADEGAGRGHLGPLRQRWVLGA